MTVDAEWFLVEPAGWVPVPAASVPDVLDKRVVLAEAPSAFRYDMRAVSVPYPHSDGVVYVEVVSEHDWYRSRIRGEPVPKSRYPVEQVWVEFRAPDRPGPAAAATGPTAGPGPAGSAGSASTGAGSASSGTARLGTAGSVFDRVVAPDRPPTRRPRRAQEVPDLTGRRIIVLQPDGPVFHRRAVSEPYVDPESGDVSATVCSEHDWYRWAITRQAPRAEACPIYLIWVE